MFGGLWIMKKIGLLDIDSHGFPCLPLMKLSSWHKVQGDEVEWAIPFNHYDTIYRSKIFTFSPDDLTYYSANQVIRVVLATTSKAGCPKPWNTGERPITASTRNTSSLSSSTHGVASVPAVFAL